jgi:hypothetical protein
VGGQEAGPLLGTIVYSNSQYSWEGVNGFLDIPYLNIWSLLAYFHCLLHLARFLGTEGDILWTWYFMLMLYFSQRSCILTKNPHKGSTPKKCYNNKKNAVKLLVTKWTLKIVIFLCPTMNYSKKKKISFKIAIEKNT